MDDSLFTEDGKGPYCEECYPTQEQPNNKPTREDKIAYLKTLKNRLVKMRENKEEGVFVSNMEIAMLESILEDVRGDAVKDLGVANGWEKEPDIVKECKRLKHKTSESSNDPPFRRHYWEVRCDICGYIYHYDSS